MKSKVDKLDVDKLVPVPVDLSKVSDVPPGNKMSWQRHNDVYVSNDVSMERRQDVSVVHLHDVLLESRDNVSRGRNNDVRSVGLHNVPNK